MLEDRLALSLSTIAIFHGSQSNAPNGDLAIDASGNLYGTTARGGPDGDGSVFEISKGSGTMRTLAAFDGADGYSPNGGLILDSDGNLYGTTQVIGPNSGYGTVFEVAKGSGKITTLATFDGTDGFNPNSGLIMDSNGNLYGTTGVTLRASPGQGEGYGNGTVFEVAKGSGKITTLASFDSTNGTSPTGGLVMDGDGNLYGTTGAILTENSAGRYLEPERYGEPTVFEVARGSGNVSTLASLTNGMFSAGELVMDSGGNLYGTSTDGNGGGSVFELAKGGGAVTVVASLDRTPRGRLVIDRDGNLYGATASFDGIDHVSPGSIFEIAKGAGAVTNLATFPVLDVNSSLGDAPDGFAANGGLVIDTSGDLYGATADGGANRDGSVFELAAGSQSIVTLASAGGGDGYPNGGLVANDAGDLYGTDSAGGIHGAGTVFEISNGSSLVTTIASFDAANGGPNGRLVMDNNGNLYGITSDSGSNPSGSVFEIAKGNGAVTTLAVFDGSDGSFPAGDLVIDAGGNLYGATENYGSGGTLFKLARGSGAITALVSFNQSGSLDGLVMDNDGNLFGAYGGGYSQGTAGPVAIFEFSQASGTMTTLATVPADMGAPDNLVVDGAGNLYGATLQGGSDNLGTVFEVAKGSGTLATLASFEGGNGSSPGALTIDGSGNLYGTTSGGGPYNHGTLFELAKGSNAITVLASFGGTVVQNGYDVAASVGPVGPLVVDGNGYLYGVTTGGGDAEGDGTIFEFSPLSTTSPPIVAAEGRPFSGEVATFTFADGSRPPSDFTGAINWGDGQTSPGTVSESGTTYSIIGTHTYTTAGTFATTTTVVVAGNSTPIVGNAVVGATAVQEYVAAVFDDVLGRSVDPSGLQYWTQQLAAGTPISGVAQAIAHSAEYYANMVIKPDYLRLLGRAADDAGVQYWIAQMQAGLTDQGLEAQLVASDEFYGAALGNSGPGIHPDFISPESDWQKWLSAAYKALLDRPVDSDGENYWLGELSRGASLLQVAMGIAQSTENNTQLIHDDYFHYLGRAADADGLAYWLNQFANGATNEDLIAGFTGSAEYYDEHTA